MASQSTERLELTNDLYEALAQNALEVHYQPIVELATGQMIGVETLLRWEHPVRGWIPPTTFVPLAEESGLIAALDRWVLNRACRDAAVLRAENILNPEAHVAVNISARNIGDPDILSAVREAALSEGLPFDALVLEVTETGLMADAAAARKVLDSLRELGVGIALDDFGTGYSSLNYVRQLPVTAIKIDRGFVQQIAERPTDLAIAASVVDLARAVGLRTIAEGVETREQLALLHALGCSAGQGFLWSPGVPRDELAALVQNHPMGFLDTPASVRPKIAKQRSIGTVTNSHGLHRIQVLRRSGASHATIAAALNSEGFRTPLGLRWHLSSVTQAIDSLSAGTSFDATTRARAFPARSA